MHLGDQLEVKDFQKIRVVRTGEMEVDIEVNCRMEFCQRVAHVGKHAEEAPWLWLKSPVIVRLVDSGGIISMALALWGVGNF